MKAPRAEFVVMFLLVIVMIAAVGVPLLVVGMHLLPEILPQPAMILLATAPTLLACLVAGCLLVTGAVRRWPVIRGWLSVLVTRVAIVNVLVALSVCALMMVSSSHYKLLESAPLLIALAASVLASILACVCAGLLYTPTPVSGRSPDRTTLETIFGFPPLWRVALIALGTILLLAIIFRNPIDRALPW